MKINQNIVIDFNNQVDSLRTKLIGQPIPDFCNTEEKENIFFKLQTQHINRLEIARRIFNEYAENGIVKIPD